MNLAPGLLGIEEGWKEQLAHVNVPVFKSFRNIFEIDISYLTDHLNLNPFITLLKELSTWQENYQRF